MEPIFYVSRSDEVITLKLGWTSEDAGYFSTEFIQIKMSEITKKRLVFAQAECIKHGWWGIEVNLNEKDEVHYLDEYIDDDDDYITDVEYYRVTSDQMIFHSQHKHNSNAQIESEFFTIK